MFNSASQLCVPNPENLEVIVGSFAAVIIVILRYGYKLKREADRLREEASAEPHAPEQLPLPFREDVDNT